MVLLIQYYSSTSNTDIVKFTFQYGSTYTLSSSIATLSLITFTFQYGSTYTKYNCYSLPNCKEIYIPIWFYLYEVSIEVAIDDGTFTFQYGSTYTLYVIVG